MNPFGRKKDKDSKSTDNAPKKDIKSTEKIDRSAAKKLPDFLNSLSEKQINLIYSLSNIKRLEPKEFLYKEGQTPTFLSIVLEGQVISISTKLPTPRPFGTGTIFSARAFIENSPFDSAAYATAAATVMILEKKAMEMLDDKIKEVLYLEIIKQYAEHAETMATAGSENNQKIDFLSRSLYNARTAQIYDYEKSELILNIIKKIPKLPAYTHTLSTKLLDDNASSNEVVDLIRQDPALVADVLKSVNSSYYGLEQKVSDINSAVLLLGFQSLYQLIMSEGIRKTMPDTPSFKKIHTHALAISYIAFSLSMSTKTGVPVQMATVGLLHNMGESVVSLLAERNPNLSVFINSLDRPSLGAFLLEAWNFPKSISQAVKYQSFPEFSVPENIPEEIQPQVAVLYISQMCYQSMCGQPEDALPMAYFDTYKKILKLDKPGLAEITQKYIVSDLKKKQDTLPSSLKSILFPSP